MIGSPFKQSSEDKLKEKQIKTTPFLFINEDKNDIKFIYKGLPMILSKYHDLMIKDLNFLTDERIIDNYLKLLKMYKEFEKE